MTTMTSVSRSSMCLITIFSALFFMCESASSSSSNSEPNYFETLGPYFHHENVTGPNPTAIVTLPRGKSQIAFGAMIAFDDPLTVTPYINSTTIGRAEGLQVVDSLDGQRILVTLTLVLRHGTLHFSGQYLGDLTGVTTRLPCIGGTGAYSSVTEGSYDFTVYYLSADALNTILNVTVYYHIKSKGI